jgi:hypothetical protein
MFSLFPNSATHTHTHTHTNKSKSNNFDTIHFVLENPLITVLDTLLFNTELLIYAATSPSELITLRCTKIDYFNKCNFSKHE